jgi:protein-tyrosine phosphatase
MARTLPPGPRRLCFVCLGNICRSPTAEATFQRLVERQGLAHEFTLDSAGTGGHHRGEPAHPGTRREAERRGVRITHRARQVSRADFDRFDLLLAMDRRNHADLLALATSDEQRARVHLFRSFDPGADDDEVPDPYYSGEFDRVFDICQRASEGLLARLLSGNSAPDRR